MQKKIRNAQLQKVPFMVIAGDDDVEAFRSALRGMPGPVLAYCRSGTRSATAWALGQAGDRPADEILSAGRSAGYDLSHLGPMLRR